MVWKSFEIQGHPSALALVDLVHVCLRPETTTRNILSNFRMFFQATVWQFASQFVHLQSVKRTFHQFQWVIANWSRSIGINKLSFHEEREKRKKAIEHKKRDIEIEKTDPSSDKVKFVFLHAHRQRILFVARNTQRELGSPIERRSGAKHENVLIDEWIDQRFVRSSFGVVDKAIKWIQCRRTCEPCLEFFGQLFSLNATNRSTSPIPPIPPVSIQPHSYHSIVGVDIGSLATISLCVHDTRVPSDRWAWAISCCVCLLCELRDVVYIRKTHLTLSDRSPPRQ